MYVDILPMEPKRSDLLQGTLDLLILKTIARGAMHGYAISQRICEVSRDTLLVQQGSLYPALHRMEKKGLVTAEWKASENGRMAKFYSITREGEKQLGVEVEQWQRYALAIQWVLEA